MSNKSKKRSVLVVVLAVIAATIIFILAKAMFGPKTNDTNSSIGDSSSGVAISESKPETNNVPTIASEWQWHKVDKKLGRVDKATDSQTSLPFTPKSVHDALQAVKVDENGDIILDNDAQIALDEALERIYNRLDGETLGVLQDLIKAALPGKVGEQTAQLVGDYNQFLKAKEEFSQVNENSSYTGAEQTVASVKSDESLYSELQALREVYLGSDTASSLFHESDANAQFMFDSMKLGLDKSLTPQEREKRRQEIQARLSEQVEHD